MGAALVSRGELSPGGLVAAASQSLRLQRSLASLSHTVTGLSEAHTTYLELMVRRRLRAAMSSVALHRQGGVKILAQEPASPLPLVRLQTPITLVDSRSVSGAILKGLLSSTLELLKWTQDILRLTLIVDLRTID